MSASCARWLYGDLGLDWNGLAEETFVQSLVATRLPFGRVCVNLSAKEFVQQDVVANVRRVLTDTGLSPERLELEITESVAMHNIGLVRRGVPVRQPAS